MYEYRFVIERPNISPSSMQVYVDLFEEEWQAREYVNKFLERERDWYSKNEPNTRVHMDRRLVTEWEEIE